MDSTGIHPLRGHYTPGGFLALAIIVLAAAAFWAVSNKLTRNFDDHREMFENRNVGYALVRALQIVGLAYALQGVVGYSTDVWWQHALWALGDAIWAGALFGFATPILNWMIRRFHSSTNTMTNQQTTVSLVLGVFYITYGLVIGSILPGPGYGLVHMFFASALFTLVGMAFVTTAYVLATKPKWLTLESDPDTKHSLAYAIEHGNWTAAMFASIFVFGLGIVTSSAAATAFDNEFKGLVTLVVGAAIMLVIVGIGQFVVDKFVLTHATLKQVIERDDRIAGGIACAFALFLFLGSSWLIG